MKPIPCIIPDGYEKIMGPKGEPNITMLLNGHSSKLTLSDLSLHIQISASLNSHQRSFRLKWMVIETEVTSQGAGNKRL